MNRIKHICVLFFCGMLIMTFPITVYAAPVTIFSVMYGRNSIFNINFLFAYGRISLNCGDYLAITFFTKYKESGADFVDLSLTLSSSTNNAPFNNRIIETKQSVDMNDTSNNASIGVLAPRIYFNEPGTYPITAEIENLTTGGTSTFQFTVVVKEDALSSTPPTVDTSSSSSSSLSSLSNTSSSSSIPSSNIESSDEDDSSKIILPPDPVNPTPPDPPLPYNPENDPLWIDLANRLSSVVSGLFPVYFDNPDADYLPVFIAEALLGKDINLLINHLGNEYIVSGLLLTEVYAGVDIPFLELPVPNVPIEVTPPKMSSQLHIMSVNPNGVTPLEPPILKDIEPAASIPVEAVSDSRITSQSITLPYRAVPTPSETKIITPKPISLASDPGQKHLFDAASSEQTPHSLQKWATVPFVAGITLALIGLSKNKSNADDSPSKTKLVVVKL